MAKINITYCPETGMIEVSASGTLMARICQHGSSKRCVYFQLHSSKAPTVSLSHGIVSCSGPKPRKTRKK